MGDVKQITTPNPDDKVNGSVRGALSAVDGKPGVEDVVIVSISASGHVTINRTVTDRLRAAGALLEAASKVLRGTLTQETKEQVH